MKPVLDYLVKNLDESFATRLFDYNYFPTPWHFHPEYELVLVVESTGKRIIGDHISEFGPGNLVLIGPDLPHLYRNTPEFYLPNTDLKAKSIVVHFDHKTFGDGFLSLPESKNLNHLLIKSSKGINITGRTNTLITSMLFEVLELNGMARWLKLLEILNCIAESDHLELITTNFIVGRNGVESERMKKVLHFVYQNFKQDITIGTVAGIANMANNSFSRYFSQRTRQSFTSFLNEIRLAYATTQLIETQRSVLEISLDSGFNNLSNFNSQFKMRYQQSPLNFRKNYLHTHGSFF
ncbi:AraC family transcriptional regulator [Flavobacterium psychroterrae]|uniref:AraC family transcriptional regulator n=1 Tax=Flavobacterium psychroterrae TaxID=2133767 RepID=A0ABS5PHN0_9FLAO|nr:AraC family transcriptional regulator [Flavobacterium psychroterrae]MBS7233787.1 AraC family transcriptional regulator [Flavobacterium psychroterrae]